MFKVILFIILLLLPFIVSASGKNSRVPIVKDGLAVSVIITADEPTASAKQASEDLQMWLQKTSGAVVPIVKESNAGNSDGRSIILVGDTRRTRSLNIDPGKFETEEHVIRTFPGILVIAGDDEMPNGVQLKGTCNAAGQFAERFLGVRLLWPGETGTVVPSRPTVIVEDINIKDKPFFISRRVRNQAYNGITHTKIDALGWDHAPFKVMVSETDTWLRFHGAGEGSHRGNYGHAFGNYWDRFHETHPEWFALQPDGTRDNSQPTNSGYESHRLCVSNRELIEHIAKECIEQLRNNPALETVSVSPNDGGPQSFCLCENCKAWDAWRNNAGTSSDEPDAKGDLSDRYARFFSEVAAMVAKEFPDRNVGAYAYDRYTLAPVKTEVNPNVTIGFVIWRIYQNDKDREIMKENWGKWSEKASKLFLYSNAFMALSPIPTLYIHKMAEDMRFFADHKMLFIDQDCMFGYWSTNGLNYYILTRLLWNPYQDVEILFDDYCISGFGPAAAIIKNYFLKLEQINNTLAAENSDPRNAQLIARHYSDDTLNELRRLLDEAARHAARDEAVMKRIDFLRQGLDYTPICREFALSEQKARGKDGNKWDWREFMERCATRYKWFQDHGPTHALHYPHMMYWGW